MNLNYETIKVNNELNIIPSKNSLTVKKTKEGLLKFDCGNNKEKKFATIMNNLTNLKESFKNIRIKNKGNKGNKMKELKKIINIYKNDDENNNIIKNKDENVQKEEESNKRTIKPKSMFMTEMNFLINDKNKINNNNKKKEIKEIKNINYDSFSFKELLKHIENDKKKIIDNQNDLDIMIKTTKDTHYEIWKWNHHH